MKIAMRQSITMNNSCWLKLQCICLVVLATLAPLPLAHADEGTEISILLSQIRSGNKEIRDLAVSELWIVSSESITEALTILKSALNDKDTYVRRIAAAVMERVNSNAAADAVSALRDALKDSDPWVRSSAADSLGMIGGKAVSEAVQALKEGLHDKSPSVRLAATRAIGRVGQPTAEAVTSLIDAAKDPNQLIRRAAVAALGEVLRSAPRATPESLAALRNSLNDRETLVRVSTINAIGRLGSLAEALVPELQESLEDNQEFVRRAGINSLGQLARAGIEEARRALERELTAPRADVRLFTVEVFGRMGLSTQKLAALFLEILSDPEPKMRRAAAIALGNVKPAEPEVISALENGLTDEDKSVREASVRSLSSTGSISMETSPKVYPLLKDSSTEVRRATAIALGSVRPASPGTILALRETLSDDNGLVRQAAVWALVSLGSTPPDAVPTIKLMLRDPETEIRRGAVVALGRIGQGAADAVSALIDLLRDPNQQVRQDVVNALGNIGPLAAIAVHPLKDVMVDHHENSNVRQAAADALGKMGPVARDSIPSIREVMGDDNEQISSVAARALVKIGSPAEIVPVLIGDVKSQRRTMQRAALTALIELGPAGNGAVPVLIEILNTQEADASSKEQLSSMAARALGEMGIDAQSALPDLTKSLDEPKTRYAAAAALINISRTLLDASAIEMIPLLETAYNKISKIEGIAREDLYTMRLVIASLNGQRWKSIGNQLFTEYRNFTVVSFLVFVLLIVYGITLWFSPITLLRWDAFWSGLPRTGTLEKVADVALFLGGWFCYQPRVLDAWIDKNMGVASQEFLNRATVKNRAVHIPLPVLCDGKVATNFSPQNIRSTFESGQGCVLILGEGGAGKTSLACQIAQWAMADDPSSRLCKHRMIPVLIEEELEDPTSPTPVQLIEIVRGQLRNLLRLEEPIQNKFFRHLLIRKRVLIIIDHLSEMSHSSRAKVRPSAPDFPINALVVTSRIKDELEGSSKVVVQPLRLDGNRISYFVVQYLQGMGKHGLLTDPELFEECKRLSVMAGNKNVTVLLAKLYVDLLIAKKESHVDEQLPNNVPELIIHYVDLINNTAAPNALDNATVLRVSRIVAWECLRLSLSPSQASRKAVLHALTDEANPEQALKYLEERLHLITTLGPEQRHVKFTLDPLAEYLAAMLLVEQYGNDETQWRKFLQQADLTSQSQEQIQGFLSAVNDCFLAKCAEFQLPQFVLQELEKRLAAESVAEGLIPNSHEQS